MNERNVAHACPVCGNVHLPSDAASVEAVAKRAAPPDAAAEHDHRGGVLHCPVCLKGEPEVNTELGTIPTLDLDGLTREPRDEPSATLRRLYAKIVALRDTIPHGQSARAALGEVLSLIEEEQA